MRAFSPCCSPPHCRWVPLPRLPPMSCSSARSCLPSQWTIGRSIDSNNSAQIYAVRTHLMINAQRACRHGASNVQLVLDDPQRIETLRAVAVG
ncbi:hypothetical protein GCM10027432_23280 [Lysobacter fragariae]